MIISEIKTQVCVNNINISTRIDFDTNTTKCFLPCNYSCQCIGNGVYFTNTHKSNNLKSITKGGVYKFLKSITSAT